jgi:hypothetical protein
LIYLTAAVLAQQPLLAQHCCNVDIAQQAGTEAVATGELGTLRYSGDKLLYTIPLKYIGRECLLSACISRTTNQRALAVGSRKHVTHARIDYIGGNVYLRKVNTSVAGNQADSASLHSIADSNVDGYLAKLPIVKDAATPADAITVDVTELFTTDNVFQRLALYIGRSRATLDSKLSRVMECKVFDDNLSIRALYSYRSSASDSQDGDISSAEIVHSLLLLPEDKMRPRFADSRMGLFTDKRTYIDLSRSDYFRTRTLAQRWRVEPADWDAWRRGELVEPQKHIVYYIDNEFPERWKEPLRKGILKWNEGFARLGLKDVVEVRDYPTDDPDFDEDNLKYNCIRYIATNRGCAQGPSWSDPTTGELLSASVFVWASLPEIMNRFCFVQTAQANKDIRSGHLSDHDLDIAIQNIITHEIGHTLGMAHNMGASSAYPVDSLLNADFVKQNGITPSVMDYIYYNYIVPPENTDVPVATAQLGSYDKLCLEYIYRPTSPDITAEEDLKIAETWLDAHAGDPRYRYGIQQWGNRYDPSSLIDDISDDALRAGDLAIENLKYVLTHMEEWLPGADNAVLRRDLYNELVKQYTTMLRNSLACVGGIRLNFVKEGTAGQTYCSLPQSRQKQALQWVARELHRSTWVDLRTLTSKFGPAADASAGVQTTIAKEIIEAADNIVLSAHLAADEPYTLQSYTDDLYDLFFATPAKAGELTQTDKTLQRALIHAMLDVVGGKAKAEVAMLEEAPTSFALSSDGGYLRHVYMGHIDEQKAYFLLLADKIHTLAAKMKKQSHTDTAHWLLLEKVTAGAVAE